MTTSAAEFFDDLAHRGHEPLLQRMVATVRFDVLDGDGASSHLLRIDRGAVQVLRGDAPADCVIAADRAVFDAVVDGRASLMASLLRGVLTVEGDPELLVLAQRLFRDPAVPRVPAAATS